MGADQSHHASHQSLRPRTLPYRQDHMNYSGRNTNAAGQSAIYHPSGPAGASHSTGHGPGYPRSDESVQSVDRSPSRPSFGYARMQYRPEPRPMRVSRPPRVPHGDGPLGSTLPTRSVAAPSPPQVALSPKIEEPTFKIGDATYYGKSPAFRREESLLQAEMLAKEDSMKAFTMLRVDNGICLNVVTQTCPICFDEIKPQEGLHLTQCLHFICSGCFQSYVQASLRNAASSDCEVRCPIAECKMPITQLEVRAAAGSRAFTVYENRNLGQALSTNEDIRLCPTPDCPFAVEWIGQGSPNMHCPVCKRNFCMKCKAQPYHTDMTCEEHKQQKEAFATDTGAIRTLASSDTYRQCAKCHIFIEKSEGCYKMKCRCGYRFCWKCMTPEATCDCTPANHGFSDPVTHAFDPGLRRR